jgi:hypothetical protein
MAAPNVVAKYQGESKMSMDKHFNGTRADDLQVSGNHYKEMAVQPWELMESVLTHEEFVGFLKGNVIKYALRAGRKDGSDDLGKCRHYMLKLAEVQDAHDS